MLNRRLSFALGSALLIVAIGGVSSYRWIASSNESAAWVSHSREVIATADDLSLVMRRIDSTSQQFLLTGQDAYLQTYPALLSMLAHDQDILHVLTVDNPQQQQRLSLLGQLSHERLLLIDKVMAARRRDGLLAAATLYESIGEPSNSTAFQTASIAFRDEETRLLTQRNADEARRRMMARTILIIDALIGLAVAATASWLAYRGSVARSVAERSLRDSEEKYRLLLDGVQDHGIFLTDPDGRITSWSAGAERINGYTAMEIIGQNRSRFFSATDIESGRPTEVLRIAAQTGRYQVVGVRQRKDGSQFLADVTVTALRNGAGELLGYSEFSSDLSEGTESEARYRGLLEAAPDAMVVVNQKGRIVLLNMQAETQFGYRRDELVGQEVKNIIPVGFAERLVADALRSTEDALAQQIGTGIELSGHRKDGSAFPIEIMLSPLESADGILVTAAIRNITKRKLDEAELIHKVKELHRSNEELAQFANLASHDLQEPLRMVASYTQLLSKRYAGRLDSDADEFIAYAVDGANRMQRLIQGLLAYSRIGTTGKEFLQISSDEALTQALLNVGGAIQDSGAVITHDALPSVLADESQLIQLLQNLISNAIKYQPPGVPRIHITATRDGKYKWMFSVADNGLGIEAQFFEKIFGMFQRLHKREEYNGTGIGLAICKKIVERHGGTLCVESQIGIGSTFRFALTGSDSA